MLNHILTKASSNVNPDNEYLSQKIPHWETLPPEAKAAVEVLHWDSFVAGREYEHELLEQLRAAEEY